MNCRTLKNLLPVCLMAALTSCASYSAITINPFFDLDVVPMDGVPRDLENTIAPLGEFEAGEVIRVLVEGAGIDSVLMLGEDDSLVEAGVIVGGGPANEAFDYRIPEDGRYFVFVLFGADVAEPDRSGTIAVSPGEASSAPAERQVVVLSFDEGFLSDPGLFDPESGTEEEQAFLESISGQVRDGVEERLNAIFAGTPIEIVDERDGLPDGDYSRVTFSAERVVAGDAETALDVSLPLTATADECLERVIFGEVLPRGAGTDAGNRDLNDEAVVYVGSFQGRGESCRTAATDAVNNIILGLSQTAAHEIGHLVGLFHVTLVDLMDRSPSLAFQRELSFSRGQLLVEAPDESGSPVTTVLTTIIQDPQRYFESAFAE